MIVGSILLAFGIEARWQVRQDRVEEQAVLVELREDFGNYLDLLESARRGHELRIEAAHFLLDASGPSPGALDEDAFHHALARVSTWSQLLLPDGMLGSLVDAGGLTLIRDDDLRRRLTDWAEGLERVDELNGWIVQVVTSFRTYLLPRYPTLAVARVGRDFDLIEGDGSRFPVQARALLSELEFENRVAASQGASELYLADLPGLEEAVRGILSLLETEIE